MKKFVAAWVAIALGVTMMPAMAKSSQAADAQADYLTTNIKKPGWKSTSSGLQYREVKKSPIPGAKQAPKGANVTVHYEGTLIDGKVFDSSYQRKEPATFPLGAVIEGWQEGVPLMRVGDIYEFAIPYTLAYGAEGRPPVIPPAATLLFKIELIYINE